MQDFYKRFSVVGGFLLLLAVLAVNAFMTRRQLSVQVATQQGVEHTRQVLFELSETESLLKDAETGQRGYLYTSDPAYLAPYNDATAHIGAHLDSLARLTANDAPEQARLPLLRTLVEQKLAELATTIALYQADRAAEAKNLVLSDSGLKIMDQIRDQMSAMEEEESSLQAIRYKDYQKSIRYTVISIYLASFLAAAGLILLAVIILREIDLREKHAREIRQSEEWFRVTLTSIGDGVIATDANGRVTFLNPNAEQLTGWNQAHAVGKPIVEIFPIFHEFTREPVENPAMRSLATKSVVGLANHTVLQRKNGSFTPIEDSAAPIRDDRNLLTGAVLVFRDATFERESQAILRKTEKLAAAARLAATFAHEINNPLEAVVNLVYLVKGMEALPAAAVDPLDLAEQELERISHIARQTLGFYRESRVPDAVDLPVIIENVLKLYSNKLKNKGIQVEREFSPDPPVLGLSGELTQAVSNLISNAADAVEAHGKIRLHLRPVNENEKVWIELIVEDDGPGVTDELRDRIFEPFFTTKADVGTGLGLWVTKEILGRHGGTIEIVSKSGDGSRGAVFKVLLPGIAQS